jgi:hypothetical protein
MPSIHQLAIPACVILTLCGAACADQPSQQRVAAQAAPTCVTSGSRIPQNCSVSPSRSYTDQAIQQTGADNTARALRMLDPDISRP